ncbi:hypothetical protein CAEBREN_10025 [Caenorhabditis brenneri]|uniref:Uncharacterized protein n=1 Tax=Caenorhabditis brenneri TaxID=135651 RepID=G0N9E0_CAEBE|nr:hypothetical protein CAEBREN_10025 [Caenorhabditis brenneri]
MASEAEYSSGGDSHHSQPPSSRRPKKTKVQLKLERDEQSLNTRIIGPAKSRVTRVTKKADLLLETGQQTTYILSQLKTTPETEGRQDTLKTADTELLDMKRSVHRLTSLYNHVDVKFNDPAMNASPNKEKHLEELYTLIANAKPYEMATQLQETIFNIEGHLKELEYSVTNYIPSDEYHSESEDEVKQRIQRKYDDSVTNLDQVSTPKLPANSAADPDQNQKMMEMEAEVKRLQAQLENQKRQALLKERAIEQTASERETWHLKQLSSVQTALLESMNNENMANKRAAQLQAEAARAKARILPTIREGIAMPQQSRDTMPPSANSVPINNTSNIPSRESAPDVNQAMLEVLQKIHEETLRSNTDIRSSLEILLNQRERGQDDSYADHKDPQEAISKTFELLEKTYGNNQTQSSLLTKLVNLPFHPSDPQQMRHNLATIIRVMEQLKNKGVPENDPRTINDVVRKLPVSIRRGVCEFMVTTGDSVTHSQIIAKIYEKIAGLDMDKSILSQGTTGRTMNEITDSFGAINLVEASRPPHTGSSNRPYPQKSQAPKSNNPPKAHTEKAPLAYVKEGLPRQYTDPATGQTLEGYYAPGSNRPDIKIMHRTFPYQGPEKSKCPVCEGPHNAIRCTLTSTDFRKLSAEKGLCPICAAKHTIEECRSPFKCGYCGGTHHMGGCPKKEFYRDPKNYPTGAKDREQFFRARAGNSSQ